MEQTAAVEQVVVGISEWTMPAPAVIHWVAPSVMKPPPPLSRGGRSPVQHVGHGLEAAVRVIGRALGLARGVLHGPHLIEQQERIGQA